MVTEVRREKTEFEVRHRRWKKEEDLSVVRIERRRIKRGRRTQTGVL